MLAKKHMAQLHDVKEAGQAFATPYAETMSEFTSKADTDLLNPRIDPYNYKDRRLSPKTRNVLLRFRPFVTWQINDSLNIIS